jgi:hypothetical protein
MTETGDAQATGTVDDAAAAIEALMEPKGQPESQEAEKEEDAPDETEGAEESEDQEPDEQANEAEEQPSYRVKVAGEEVEVTLDELVKGYSREADYTRKTMAYAEQQRQLQAEAQAVRAERERYASLLDQMEAQLAPPAISDEDLAWLAANNRTEYAIRLSERDAQRRQREEIKAERERVLGLVQQDEIRSHQSHVQGVMNELPRLIPEFATNAQQVVGDLQTFLNREGYTPEEIKWASARDLAVVYRANKYDQLMAKKPAVVERVVKTAKPGSGPTPVSKVTEVTRAKQRLAKTGRVEDAASAIERMMG